MEADYLKKIRIWGLKKNGCLEAGGVYYNTIEWNYNGSKSSISLEISLLADINKYARFTYTQKNSNSSKKDFDYKVFLITTPCNFGGRRYWFECLFCKRRAGVLYKRGDYFACRHCQNLTYESRNLSGRWKWAGKIISAPEIDALWEDVKRPFYNGSPTKKFERYLRKRQRFLQAWNRTICSLQDMQDRRERNNKLNAKREVFKTMSDIY